MTLTLDSVGVTYGGLTGKSGRDFGHGAGRYVTFTEVMAAARLAGRTLERVDVHNRERQNEVRRGDVLFNASSETPEEVALAAVVDFEVPSGVYLNSFCFGYRLTRPDVVDPTYLSYFFRSAVGRDVVFKLAQGATRYNIAKTKLLKVPLDLPSFDEQRAVATALTQIDDLIARLSDLIAKKRAVKQGMMQELLTGRARLPAFSGGWRNLRVAAASHLKARIGWQGLTTAEYRESGTHRLVGGTDIINGRVSWGTTPYVDKWRFDQDRNIQLQVGDVLITKDGTIGKVALIDDLPGPTTLNSGVFVLRPKLDAYDSRFLFCMLRSRAFDEFVAGLSAGSTINHLYQKDLGALSFTVPSDLAEQRAIAAVLLDADAEIVALERRLESTRAIKQGMMQELLTGRTRLPVGEEVSV